MLDHKIGLRPVRWGCVVVDEVHQAKNPKGQLHKADDTTEAPDAMDGLIS